MLRLKSIKYLKMIKSKILNFTKLFIKGITSEFINNVNWLIQIKTAISFYFDIIIKRIINFVNIYLQLFHKLGGKSQRKDSLSDEKQQSLHTIPSHLCSCS